MKNNKFDVINYDVPKFQVDVEFKYHKYDEETEDIHPINDFDINLKSDNVNMFLSNFCISSVVFSIFFLFLK